MKMRKSIVSWGLLLCSVGLVAQPRLRTPEMYVGAHGGATASMVYFSPAVAGVSPLNAAIAPFGGLVFRYAGHKVCAVQVELNYMQRGWREVVAATGTAQAVDYRRRLHYVEVPFLMHLYFGGEHCRGFLNLGPQAGYCIGDKASGTTGDEGCQYEPVAQKFDWGIAGGAGLYYRHARVGLFQLEARFNYSLGAIYPVRQTDYFSFANAMDLSIGLAYMWQIKGR